MKTTITKTIGGKSRDFNFGLAFMSSLEDYYDGLINYDEAVKNSPLKTSIVSIYLGARCACERNGEEIDFKLVDVYDWLDETGIKSKEFQDLKLHLLKCFGAFTEGLNNGKKEVKPSKKK